MGGSTGDRLIFETVACVMAKASAISRSAFPRRFRGQMHTTIFPPAWPDSMSLCASLISSKRKTRAGFAW